MNSVDVWNCRPMPSATHSCALSAVMSLPEKKREPALAGICAADHIEKSALPCPVGPDHPQNLRIVHVKIQVPERHQTAELLAYPARL